MKPSKGTAHHLQRDKPNQNLSQMQIYVYRDNGFSTRNFRGVKKLFCNSDIRSDLEA